MPVASMRASEWHLRRKNRDPRRAAKSQESQAEYLRMRSLLAEARGTTDASLRSGMQLGGQAELKEIRGRAPLVGSLRAADIRAARETLIEVSTPTS